MKAGSLGFSCTGGSDPKYYIGDLKVVDIVEGEKSYSFVFKDWKVYTPQ